MRQYLQNAHLLKTFKEISTESNSQHYSLNLSKTFCLVFNLCEEPDGPQSSAEMFKQKACRSTYLEVMGNLLNAKLSITGSILPNEAWNNLATTKLPRQTPI